MFIARRTHKFWMVSQTWRGQGACNVLQNPRARQTKLWEMKRRYLWSGPASTLLAFFAYRKPLKRNSESDLELQGYRDMRQSSGK